MATGVETAGLVLATIPLLLAGLEFYAKGIATSKRYWKYRQEFKSLVIELRIENAVYINSIEILLTGVVRQKDMPDFLANPYGERWKDEEFERKLKDRLGPTYEPYVEAINQMNGAAKEFRDRLKLDKAGKVRKPEYQDKRSILIYSISRNSKKKRHSRNTTSDSSLVSTRVAMPT